MKLKLRLRRNAGDEGTARSKIKVLVVALLLITAVITVITYMHARNLIMYGPKDQELVPRAKMGLPKKIKTMLVGQSLPKPSGIVDPSKYELPFQQVGIGGASSRILSAEEKRRLERRKRSRRRKDRKEERNKVYTLESWFIPDLEPRGLAVLFHDYGQSKADLIDVAAEFHDLHFSVLMVDLRASGETDGHEATFGYYEARDVAQAVLKANDFTPAGGIKVVYGIGTGAAAILRAAAEKKLQADALILEGVFDELRHFVDRRIKLTGMSPALIGAFVTLWIGRSEEFDARSHNPVAYARKVKIPTLILQGGKDLQGSKKEADRVAAALKTKAVLIPGAGRPIPTTKSDEWFDTVQPFLAKIPQPVDDNPMGEGELDAVDEPEPAALESRASH